MKMKRIKFMENVKDVNNDNIDVLIEKENGSSFTINVGTPLEEVFDLCQVYFHNLKLLDTNPNSEEFEKYKIEFNNSLEKIYLKIQKFLNEE